MFSSTDLSLLPTHSAILLVLLPTVGTGIKQETPLVRAATLLALKDLQAYLGVRIRVLKVDEDSYPGVVRAFDGRGLPAFVLLRDGVELWHQQGLPEGNESMATLLLSKLVPPATIPETPQPGKI